MIGWQSAVHLQIPAAKERVRSWPGLKSAKSIADFDGYTREVDGAIFFFENRSKRGLRIVLRNRINCFPFKSTQSLDHQVGSDGRKLWRERFSSVVWLDSKLFL